ncbi:MAG: lamin tail domain-containing protein, partial [Bacteroidota bacterium]
MNIKPLLFFLVAFSMMQPVWSQCGDLFFSEYIEGSGNNKAIEIYNSSSMAIDLTDYQVHRFNNGGTTDPDTLDLPGMLAAYDVYVAANSSADPTILAAADTTHSITFYNGDDVLVLINISTGDTLDIIGVLGVDPGSSWPVGTGSTANTTLRRMMSVQNGTTDWALSSSQWDVFPTNDDADLGMHTSVCAPMPCSDLFLSEYIEGSGNNKAIEIYNPTATAIDLTDYQVHRFNNGGTTDPDTLDLPGMLAPYDVYVAANSSADAAVLAAADTTHSITFFNGDDVLVLINVATGDTLDIFGILGVDPGSSWPVDTGATANFTLRRKAGVEGGTTDWALSSTQWDVFPINNAADIGMHTSNCEPPAMNPEVDFASTAIIVNEGDGSAEVVVELSAANADTVMVTVSLGTSTATSGTDFAWTDTTISLDAMNTTDTLT